jgi:hypothetical protein
VVGARMYVCVHVYVCVLPALINMIRVFLYTCARVHMYACVYMCVCIYIYIYT